MQRAGSLLSNIARGVARSFSSISRWFSNKFSDLLPTVAKQPAQVQPTQPTAKVVAGSLLPKQDKTQQTENVDRMLREALQFDFGPQPPVPQPLLLLLLALLAAVATVPSVVIPREENAFLGKTTIENADRRLNAAKSAASAAQSRYIEATKVLKYFEDALGRLDKTPHDKVAQRYSVLLAEVEQTKKVYEEKKGLLDRAYESYKNEIAAEYNRHVGITFVSAHTGDAMSGIRGLSPEKIDALQTIFFRLMNKNLLNDDRVMKIATLLEGPHGDDYLTALLQRTSLSDLSADLLDKTLSVQGEIELIKVHSNLSYHDVPNDGDCMYHAVLPHLGTNQDSRALRNELADYADQNYDNYCSTDVNDSMVKTGPNLLRDGKQYDSKEDYIEALRNSHDFADNIDIKILMDKLERPIAVIGPNGKLRNFADVEAKYNDLKRKNQKIEPIFIYFDGKNHYSSLTVKEGIDANAILDDLLKKSAPSLTAAVASVGPQQPPSVTPIPSQVHENLEPPFDVPEAEGDHSHGNCMYRSVIYCLGLEETPKKLRTDLIAYIREFKKSEAEIAATGGDYPNMDAYLTAMGDSNTPADSADVMFLMDKLKQPIAIVGYDERSGGVRVENEDHVEAKRKLYKSAPIFLYRHESYDPIERKTRGHYMVLKIKNGADPNVVLDELIERSMQRHYPPMS